MLLIKYYIRLVFVCVFCGCTAEENNVEETDIVVTAGITPSVEPTATVTVTDVPVIITPEPEPLNNDLGYVFTEVNESVTAKEETNLRDKPAQGDESNVLAVLKNGQVATRIGESNSGWSKVKYNDKIYYAVSSLLTSDLTYKPPVLEDDGIKTVFTEVNDKVTAKEVVNLRQKPSVNDEIAPVVVQIKNGDIVQRNGINKDVGWSRVEYNGQTLYCITSYLTKVE